MKPQKPFIRLAYAVIFVYMVSENSNGEKGSCVEAGFIGCCAGSGCEINNTCYCNIQCHDFNDCCADINETCPINPTKSTKTGSCVEAGYTGCCSKPGRGCELNGSCFCNIHCHELDDCCSDINQTCPLGANPNVDSGGSSIDQVTVISVAVLSVIILCSVACIVTTAVAFVLIKRKERKLFDIAVRKIVQGNDDGIENTNYVGFDSVHMEHHSPNSTAVATSTGNVSSEHITHSYSSVTDTSDPYSQPFDVIHHDRHGNRYSEAPIKEFWKPASQERELRRQCAELGLMDITMDNLTIHEQVGSGQFGTVHRGVWHHPDSSSDHHVERQVAVKSMKRGGSNEQERVRFLQEATIMGQFNNPHILRILGVITDSSDNNLRIVIDYMHKGDLLTHLTTLKPDPTQPVPAELGPTLLSYSRQVACGVMYLSIKKYIHRDLAARNVLVSSNGTCKIADFGLSRDLQHEGYYTSRAGGKIPVKWTAPEALLYRKYSSASDVWSYGCLLYEIWSLGAKPYGDIANTEVLQKLETGYRLPPPPGCPRNVYQLMMNCWHPNPDMRPIPGVVVAELSHPDYQVLRKTFFQARAHGNKQSRILGAPLSDGHTLFKDLQSIYRTSGTSHNSSRPTSAPYVVPSTVEISPNLQRDCHSLELHPLTSNACDQTHQTHDNHENEFIERTNTTTTKKVNIEDSHDYHLLEHAREQTSNKRSFKEKDNKPSDTQKLISVQNSDMEV